MARVSQKWLAVTATYTPREHVFSTCGLVDTADRSNLLRSSIEKKVFCYNNIKKFINFRNVVLVFTLISKLLKNHLKTVGSECVCVFWSLDLDGLYEL